jgi:flagellar biosynthesis regulator FlaF
MLNMAILIYLENQNNLLQRGVRAEMGHMGAWIEFKSEKIPSNKSKSFKNRIAKPESQATYKRGL